MLGAAAKKPLKTRTFSLLNHPASCYPLDIYVAKRNERVLIPPAVDIRHFVPLAMVIPSRMMVDSATSFAQDQFLPIPAARKKCDELDLYQYIISTLKERCRGHRMIPTRILDNKNQPIGGSASNRENYQPIMVPIHSIHERKDGSETYHLLITYINPGVLAQWNPFVEMRNRWEANRISAKAMNPSIVRPFMLIDDGVPVGTVGSSAGPGSVIGAGANAGVGAGAAAGALRPRWAQALPDGGAASGGGDDAANGNGGGGGVKKKAFSRDFLPPKTGFVPFHRRMTCVEDVAKVMTLKNSFDYMAGIELMIDIDSNTNRTNPLHPFECFSIDFALRMMKGVDPVECDPNSYYTVDDTEIVRYAHPRPENAYQISLADVDVNEYHSFRLPNPKRDNIIHLSSDMKLLSSTKQSMQNDQENGANQALDNKCERLREQFEQRQYYSNEIEVCPFSFVPHLFSNTHDEDATDPRDVILRPKSWMTSTTGTSELDRIPEESEQSPAPPSEPEPTLDNRMDIDSDTMDDSQQQPLQEQLQEQQQQQQQQMFMHPYNSYEDPTHKPQSDAEFAESHMIAHAVALGADPNNPQSVHGFVSSPGMLNGMPLDGNYTVRILASIHQCMADDEVMRVIFPDLYSLPMKPEDRRLFWQVRGSVGLHIESNAGEDDVDVEKRLNNVHRKLLMDAYNEFCMECDDEQKRMEFRREKLEEFYRSAINRFKTRVYSKNSNTSPYWRSVVKFLDDLCEKKGGYLFNTYDVPKLTTDCSLFNDWSHRFVLEREMVHQDSTCHKLQLKGYMIALTANDPNRKARIHTLAYGQHASSKSWLLECIKKSCAPIVDLFTMTTLRADTVPGNFDGCIKMQDEMNYAQAGVGKSGRPERGEEERSLKLRMSMCIEHVKDMYFDDNHNRIARESFRKCLETHMMNTNAPKRSMTPEFLDRCHAMLFMDYDRDGRNVANLLCAEKNVELARIQEDAYEQKQLIQALIYVLDQMITVDIFPEVKCTFARKALPKILEEAQKVGLPKTSAPRPLSRMLTAVRGGVKLRAVLLRFFSELSTVKSKPFDLQHFTELVGDLDDYDPSIFVQQFGLFQEYQDSVPEKVAQVIVEEILTDDLLQTTNATYDRLKAEITATTHRPGEGARPFVSNKDDEKVRKFVEQQLAKRQKQEEATARKEAKEAAKTASHSIHNSPQRAMIEPDDEENEDDEKEGVAATSAVPDVRTGTRIIAAWSEARQAAEENPSAIEGRVEGQLGVVGVDPLRVEELVDRAVFARQSSSLIHADDEEKEEHKETEEEEHAIEDARLRAEDEEWQLNHSPEEVARRARERAARGEVDSDDEEENAFTGGENEADEYIHVDDSGTQTQGVGLSDDLVAEMQASAEESVSRLAAMTERIRLSGAPIVQKRSRRIAKEMQQKSTASAPSSPAHVPVDTRAPDRISEPVSPSKPGGSPKKRKDLSPFYYANRNGDKDRRYIFFPTPGIEDDESMQYKKRHLLAGEIVRHMHGHIRREDVADILRTWSEQTISFSRGPGKPKGHMELLGYRDGGIVIARQLLEHCNENVLQRIVSDVMHGLRVLPSTFLYDIRMDDDNPFLFSQINVLGGSKYCPSIPFPTNEQITSGVPMRYRNQDLLVKNASLSTNTNAFHPLALQNVMSGLDAKKNFQIDRIYTSVPFSQITRPFELQVFMMHIETMGLTFEQASQRKILPEHMVRQILVRLAQNRYAERAEAMIRNGLEVIEVPIPENEGEEGQPDPSLVPGETTTADEHMEGQPSEDNTTTSTTNTPSSEEPGSDATMVVADTTEGQEGHTPPTETNDDNQQLVATPTDNKTLVPVAPVYSEDYCYDTVDPETGKTHRFYFKNPPAELMAQMGTMDRPHPYNHIVTVLSEMTNQFKLLQQQREEDAEAERLEEIKKETCRIEGKKYIPTPRATNTLPKNIRVGDNNEQFEDLQRRIGFTIEAVA
jgi:hypothetical protein